MLSFSSSNIPLIIWTYCQNNFINITIEARRFTAMAKTGQFGADINFSVAIGIMVIQNSNPTIVPKRITTGFFCFMVI